MTLNVQNAKKIGIGGSKNLFNKDATPDYHARCSVESTATGVKLTATETASSVAFVTYIIGKASKYAGKTVTLSATYSSSSGSIPRMYIGRCSANAQSRESKAWLDNTGSISWTVSDSQTYPYLCVSVYANATNSTTAGEYSEYSNVQLEVGSTATAYEPYVAPQEVKAIHDKDGRLLWGRLEYDTKYEGDTWQQTYSGKNLFSFDAYGTFAYGQSGNITQTHTDTSAHMVATGTSGAQYVRTTIDGFDSSKVYTVSCKAKKIVNGVDGQPRLRLYIQYSNDGSTFSSQTATEIGDPVQGQEYTLSASFSGHPYYRFYFYNNSSTPVTIGEETEYWDIQVEEGNKTVTGFEPYVGGIPAPNPDYPQDIKVATGTQTVTLTGGTVSEDYTLSLGSIELCKIGNYQDYIYKTQGGDWYIHKAIGNTALLSTTGSYNSGTNWYYESFANIGIPGGVLDGGIMSNYFTAATSYSEMQTNPSNGLIANSANHIVIRNTACTDQASYRTWLAAHEVAVYYVLATATDTVITDAVLIEKLNSIHDWLNRYGYHADVVGDLPIVINQESL